MRRSYGRLISSLTVDAASGLDAIEAGLREGREIGAGRLAQAFAALAHNRDLAFAAELHRVRARTYAFGPDVALCQNCVRTTGYDQAR
jgi:hypothetical protein